MEPHIEGLENLHLVGSGGFGKVYRAWQPDFGRDVAVKVLSATLTDDRSRARFERERQALGRLSGHPHIIAVYDHGVLDDDSPYMVMEYAAGGSLADLVTADGPMMWPAVVGYGIQICSALEAAHEAGVLHRDVKPENILLTGGGRPKLADFGIARLSDRTATQTTSLTASVLHAAPELMEGAEPSVASDIYALGSTLFCALAGHPPFFDGTHTTMPALIARIALKPPPDLRTIGVPNALAEAIERMLAKDPADRPSTATEASAMLQRAQGAAGMPVTNVTSSRSGSAVELGDGPQAASEERTDPRRQQVLVAVGVGLLALLVGGGLALGLATGNDDPDATSVASDGPDANGTTVITRASPSATPQPIATPASTPTPSPTPTTTPTPDVPATVTAQAVAEPAPPGPVFPVQVLASGQAPSGLDASGATTTFGPDNVVDGVNATCWRVSGTGVGHALTFSFAAPTQVTEISFVTGYDKVDPFDGTDRWSQNRRVLSVRVTAGDGSSTVVQLSDTRARQTVATPSLGTGTTLQVEVLTTSGHGGRDYTAISEVGFMGR